MGVFIEVTLSWTKHVSYVANKVRNSISSLYEMRKAIPKIMKKSVYNALVNSQMSYAIQIWGGYADGDKLKRLFVLQKRALRNLFGVRRVSKHIKGHTNPRFNENNILTIYNIYNYMTLLDIGKLLNYPVPQYLCKTLNINANITSRTRYKNRVFVPSFTCNRYQNNFCFLGPKLWNLLSSSPTYCNYATESKTIQSLKTKIKQLLLNMQSYQDDTNWIAPNISITSYLAAVKNDPNYVKES